MSNLSALVGAVVSCWFPQHDQPNLPGPKYRPALVAGCDAKAGKILVVYGTSQRTHLAGRGEISFSPSEIAGLSKDTKFCLRNAQWLPLKAEYFADNAGKINILGRIPSDRSREMKERIEEV